MRRLFLAALLLAPLGALAETIVILPTRGGVTQSYLLSAPETARVRAVAILFPGGAGKVDLERESGRDVLDSGNFLVRARRLLAAGGVAAAVMDAPSDRPAGMDDAFRMSEAHAEDAAKVVADLRARFPGRPVFLAGTSRGTVSAAAIGRRLGMAVDGVVLTATLFLASRKQPGLSGFDFGSIPAPLLFVHHVNDGCEYTPYAPAKQLAGRFPLISVSGGLAARSQPCQAMSEHGFLGREAATIDAITKWMLKQPYPKEIH